MIMVRLIYASKLAADCGVEEIRSILKIARLKNREKAITGVLFYNPLYFMQTIEGPREEINRLYGIIMKDKRHHDVQLLQYKEICKREFAEWSMGYISSTEQDQKIINKYSPSVELSPYEMSGEGAAGFLMDLAENNRNMLDNTPS